MLETECAPLRCGRDWVAATNVKLVTSSNDNSHSPNLEQARHELREGIESSREIVRQTRVLIELSECFDSPANDNEDRGIPS